MGENSEVPVESDQLSIDFNRLPIVDEEEIKKQYPEEVRYRLLPAAKEAAIRYVSEHDPQQWLIDYIKQCKYIDGIVSELRHIKGGQNFILRELQSAQPDMHWFRGGTMTTWAKQAGLVANDGFTPEQMNTYVIDGGANGLLYSPKGAISFFRITPRKHPVLYSLTLDNLISGLDQKAIRLVTEHHYDLRVARGDNLFTYLDFCRENLTLQRVALSRPSLQIT